MVLVCKNRHLQALKNEEARFSFDVPSLISAMKGISKNPLALGVALCIRFWSEGDGIVIVLVLEGTAVVTSTVAMLVLMTVVVLKGVNISRLGTRMFRLRLHRNGKCSDGGI